MNNAGSWNNLRFIADDAGNFFTMPAFQYFFSQFPECTSKFHPPCISNAFPIAKLYAAGRHNLFQMFILGI